MRTLKKTSILSLGVLISILVGCAKQQPVSESRSNPSRPSSPSEQSCTGSEYEAAKQVVLNGSDRAWKLAAFEGAIDYFFKLKAASKPETEQGVRETADELSAKVKVCCAENLTSRGSELCAY